MGRSFSVFCNARLRVALLQASAAGIHTLGTVNHLLKTRTDTDRPASSNPLVSSGVHLIPFDTLNPEGVISYLSNIQGCWPETRGVTRTLNSPRFERRMDRAE